MSKHDTPFFGTKWFGLVRVKWMPEALAQFANSLVVFGLIGELPFIFGVNE